MKRKHKLFLILIILSSILFSCFPMNPNRYGGQENRGRGERNRGERHRGYEERRHRNQDDNRDRDRGERNYYSFLE